MRQVAYLSFCGPAERGRGHNPRHEDPTVASLAEDVREQGQ